MPKLYLMLKDTTISETNMNKTILTVGRAANNDIVVDNLAVSSFHARIVNENGVFTLEDLNSTNGTFVNNRRISQVALSNNDSIMIGKYTLIFSDPRIEDNPDVTQNVRERLSEKTVMMNSRDVLGTTAKNPAAIEELISGTLIVLEGPTEKRENELVGRLITIGKSKTAEIRLNGFFAPRVAALVNKGKEGYYICPSTTGRKVYVNGKAIDGRALLVHGDIVEVWKVKMLFQVKD